MQARHTVNTCLEINPIWSAFILFIGIIREALVALTTLNGLKVFHFITFYFLFLKQQSILYFLIKDRPGPPTSIAVSRCSPTSATITWRSSADNNDPVVEYLVEYTNVTGGPAADNADRSPAFRSAARLRVADYERQLQTSTQPTSTTVTTTRVIGVDKT